MDGLKVSTNMPKVVVSDRPPPTVVLRDDIELSAVNELVFLLRRGGQPVAFIYRKPGGEIEVAARSNQFTSVQHAMDVMRDAAAKLAASMLKRRHPARETIA